MKRASFLLFSLIFTLLLPAIPVAWADNSEKHSKDRHHEKDEYRDEHGGPRPWAPAHGWRKKHDPYYTGYSGKKWGDDYDIIQGKCNRDKIGAVLGGAVGGVIGSTVGKGDGKTVAIIIGTVLGAVVGHQIGEEMDKTDRACIGHALELATDKRTVVWDNPDNGLAYRLTPLRGMTVNGHKCREYDLAIRGNGIDEKHREKACQSGEGTWKPI